MQDGITEEQVYALLGKPTESAGISVLGISGTSATWNSEQATISIQFANGKVALKAFASKPPR